MLRFRRHLLTPQSRVEHFMMDGHAYLCFEISTSIHCLYKAWKSQDIFYITPVVHTNIVCKHKKIILNRLIAIHNFAALVKNMLLKTAIKNYNI